MAFKNFLSKLNISKKTMNCPNCGKLLRFPVKPGKTLRISCPSCQSTFDIHFSSPFRDVFKIDRTLTLKENIAKMKQNYQFLPVRAKRSLWLVVASFILLIAMAVLNVVVKPYRTRYANPNRPLIQQNIQQPNANELSI